MSNPLDEILAEIVVFRNGETGEYQSNSPYWHDGRVKKRWIALYSDEAVAAREEAASSEGDDEVEEEPDYSTWKNEDLRTELAGRELSVDGTKADMVARLIEDDNKEG